MSKDQPSLALRPLLGLAGRFPLGGRHLAHRCIEVSERALHVLGRADVGRQFNETLRLDGIVVFGRGLCHGRDYSTAGVS